MPRSILPAFLRSPEQLRIRVKAVEAERDQLKREVAQLEEKAAQYCSIFLSSRTEVVAPVAGEIVVRNALVGGIATAQSEPMFAIIRDNELELRADFAECFMLKVQPGQKVLMHGVGQPDTLTGTIRLVEPAIALASRLANSALV